jgi:large subunit ribosomal protein L21
MASFAVIETGGKQYLVCAGAKVKVEKLDATAGAEVSFSKVLLRGGKDSAVEVGAPYLPGAVVVARVVRQGRGRKKIVFKYHSKTRERKKKGHRQPFTEVEVTKI